MKPITNIIYSGFALFALACFGLLPTAQAQLSPPPDGGYGSQNTAEGTDALFSLTTGVWNVAVGFQALFNDTIGNQNTATGYRALFNNMSGNKSTAYGSQALLNNTTGNDNVATGFSTLFTNISGNRNTGVGYRTLLFNDADDNTAIGWNALFNNRTGVQNTAIGSGALLHGSGSLNTAIGFDALNNNGTGEESNAVGAFALFNNTTGSGNVAVGFEALESNMTAGVDTTDGMSVGIGFQALQSNLVEDNNAVGHQALQNNTTGKFNNAFGWHALIDNVTGFFNTAIGDDAGGAITGTGNVCVGASVFGVAGESNTTRIRNILGTFQPFSPGVVGFVTVGPGNKLGNGSFSSRRYKDDIKPMDNASEKIFALKPVAFRYKKEFEPSHSQQYGLIAEDVVKVDPNLVVYDEEGKVRSVRYDLISNMLLNEFLKEHNTVEEQQASIAELKKEIGTLTATVKEQATQIQKVSAQVEMSKPAAKVVNNNQ